MQRQRDRHDARSLIASVAALVSLLCAGCTSSLIAPPAAVRAFASAEAVEAASPMPQTLAPPTVAVPGTFLAPTRQASTGILVTQIATRALPTMATVALPSTPPVATPATAAPQTAPSATVATKPSGSQLLSRSFYSVSLGREMPYFIYLPVGYAESGKRYPVLYMLHGYGGSNTEWLSVGFPEEADTEMNTGEIPPMLIVFPQGDQAYWVNHATDGELWGDYAALDVVAEIDAAYRTVPDAAHRAIGGLSMGAHGAMQLAMNYPGTFGVVGMHSPTLRDFADRFDYFGDEAFFDAHDPVHLVQQYPERAQQLKIFIDVGEQDQDWHDKTVAFHDLLVAEGIPHEFFTWPGQHDGAYWGAHNRDYLHFYAANLAPA